jgi:hypothetical protein
MSCTVVMFYIYCPRSLRNMHGRRSDIFGRRHTVTIGELYEYYRDYSYGTGCSYGAGLGYICIGLLSGRQSAIPPTGADPLIGSCEPELRYSYE